MFFMPIMDINRTIRFDHESNAIEEPLLFSIKKTKSFLYDFTGFVEVPSNLKRIFSLLQHLINKNDPRHTETLEAEVVLLLHNEI